MKKTASQVADTVLKKMAVRVAPEALGLLSVAKTFLPKRAPRFVTDPKLKAAPLFKLTRPHKSVADSDIGRISGPSVLASQGHFPIPHKPFPFSMSRRSGPLSRQALAKSSRKLELENLHDFNEGFRKLRKDPDSLWRIQTTGIQRKLKFTDAEFEQLLNELRRRKK